MKAQSCHSFIFISLAITLSFISILTSTLGETITTHHHSFKVDLIHRDSPYSPYYDSSISPSTRIVHALQRSFHRALRLKNVFQARKYNDQIDLLVDGAGEYLVNISIGTPPVPALVITDTGSDLIWVQCKPCIQCYKQKPPIFDPSHSSTYKNIFAPCPSSGFMDTSSHHEDGCKYTQVYGDGSYTSGVYASEKFTFGSFSLQDTTFGCGHENKGFRDTESGLVGLGLGNLSLISQMGSLAASRFTYCLVQMFGVETMTSGTLSFGKAAKIYGRGEVSTHFHVNTPYTFYFLDLEAVSVAGTRLPFNGSLPGFIEKGKGNIIIDSGTVLTLLPTDFYKKFESLVKQAIKSKPISIPDSVLSLCYHISKAELIPTITFHFKGADVKLSPLNTFVQISEEHTCLAFASSDITIYGSLAQINFLVGYNLYRKTVTFKPTNCNKV